MTGDELSGTENRTGHNTNEGVWHAKAAPGERQTTPFGMRPMAASLSTKTGTLPGVPRLLHRSGRSTPATTGRQVAAQPGPVATLPVGCVDSLLYLEE
jgi:hypothetical protein